MKLWTKKELAQKLDVSPQTITNWIDRGQKYFQNKVGNKLGKIPQFVKNTNGKIDILTLDGSSENEPIEKEPNEILILNGISGKNNNHNNPEINEYLQQLQQLQNQIDKLNSKLEVNVNKTAGAGAAAATWGPVIVQLLPQILKLIEQYKPEKKGFDEVLDALEFGIDLGKEAALSSSQANPSGPEQIAAILSAIAPAINNQIQNKSKQKTSKKPEIFEGQKTEKELSIEKALGRKLTKKEISGIRENGNI